MAETRALALEGRVASVMPDGRALGTRAIGYVVGFWWLATGLIIAMQRNGPTRVLALFTATMLLCVGYREIWVRRDADDAYAARRSFLGGAFVWGWVSVTFYGGWIVGLAPTRTPPTPSWASALLAIRAMIFTDVTALVGIAIAYLLVRGARNKAGAHGLLAFWTMQQIAKLAVFFGVKNPAGNFLPPHLAHLQQFFGPGENSRFLWVGMSACALSTAVLVRRARRAPSGGARQEAAMLAVLFGLAVLELAILGVRVDAGFWGPFLAARASG